MPIPVIYANTEFISGKYTFKTVLDGSNLSLTQLASAPTCNVMTFINGNVGIGLTNPNVELDVDGTIQTSNLTIFGNVRYTTPQITNVQVSPIRKVFYVDSLSQSVFTLNTPGFYGGDASNVQIFIGQSLLSYYSSSITDYTLNITYNSTDTLYTITLIEPADYASLVDITVWPTIIPTSIHPGSVYQTVNVNSLWQYGTNQSIYYYISGGNVGIGTTNPTQALHIVGDILTTGTVTASNMSVIGDFVTLNTITSNTEQMVITNAGTGPALKVTQTGTNSIAEFYDDNDVLALKVADGGNVGIGITLPQSALHVNGTITAGNTPFAVYTALGNLSASGTEVDVSLPTNTTINSIFNLSGLTSNTATGDWIPFTTNNIYGGSYFNWNVGHYIHYTSNVIKLVSNDTTANKPFKLCILSIT